MAFVYFAVTELVVVLIFLFNLLIALQIDFGTKCLNLTCEAFSLNSASVFRNSDFFPNGITQEEYQWTCEVASANGEWNASF